jgi:hypothetical protein
MKLIKMILIALLLTSLTTAISAKIIPSIGYSRTQVNADNNVSSIIQYGDGLILGIRTEKLIEEKLGYYIGGYYMAPTKLETTVTEINDVKVTETTTDPVEFIGIGAKIGLRKVFTKFYFNGGLNYTLIRYRWKNDEKDSLSATKGAGVHFGV